MANPKHIAELEIVGYGTVLNAHMLPTRVPPVFRVRSNPESILFPPYTFAAGYVLNATTGSPVDLAKLVKDGEITEFSEFIQAQPDFDLWVDQERHPHYERRAVVRDTLRGIADCSIRAAREAFAKADWPEVERLCGIALSADDKLIVPLALKAAIRRRKNDRPGERVLIRLASHALDEDAFGALITNCMALTAHTPESQDFFGSRPMYGMASRRPELRALAA